MDDVYDFIQEDKPSPGLEYPGSTWLRTTDWSEFSWDEPHGFWIEIGGTTHYHGSGPNSAGIGFLRFHNILHTAVRTWRPYHDMLFYFTWASCDNNPTSNYILQYRDGASVLATMGFGSGQERKQQDIAISADTAFNIIAVETNIVMGPILPDRWSAGVHFKRIVQ